MDENAFPNSVSHGYFSENSSIDGDSGMCCKSPQITRDFRETLKYNDKESYVSQRHHNIGDGLYNTDEIENLPPRFRKQVERAWKSFFAACAVTGFTYPIEEESSPQESSNCHQTAQVRESTKSFNKSTRNKENANLYENSQRQNPRQSCCSTYNPGDSHTPTKTGYSRPRTKSNTESVSSNNSFSPGRKALLPNPKCSRVQEYFQPKTHQVAKSEHYVQTSHVPVSNHIDSDKKAMPTLQRRQLCYQQNEYLPKPPGFQKTVHSTEKSQVREQSHFFRGFHQSDEERNFRKEPSHLEELLKVQEEIHELVQKPTNIKKSISPSPGPPQQKLNKDSVNLEQLQSQQKSSQIHKVESQSLTKSQPREVLFSPCFEILEPIYSHQRTEIHEPVRSLIPRAKELGFFLHVNVSESSNEINFWRSYFNKHLENFAFEVDYCCEFTESLILNFQVKQAALKASSILYKIKQKTKEIREPHMTSVSKLKTHLVKPCDCEDKMVNNCREYVEEFVRKYETFHLTKLRSVKHELSTMYKNKHMNEKLTGLEATLESLNQMKISYHTHIKNLMCKIGATSSSQEICMIKKNFVRECSSFKRGLPIYALKSKVMDVIQKHSVSIVTAETGSGKSTQLAEYLLQSWYGEKGSIVCTQPRKIAAISVANYVCDQIGCAVGQLVGYDVGLEKKYDRNSKIIYMTDYALLKKCLRNRKLLGVSCIIIDEAHERTLYTDLLLGLMKQCIEARPEFRVIITSATIDPTVFVRFFNLPETAVVSVPGKIYPVEVIWHGGDVTIGWDYVTECVKTAVDIHIKQPKGDILVFLTSPSEIDEAILIFRDMCPRSKLPHLLSLHGKCDIKEQMVVFYPTINGARKVVFATNAAETSLTIPGIKYVIDSGMSKELVYFPERNKSSLKVNFINKSSAEQRKGRAGRTQAGKCYRMYSKRNFAEMSDRATPEMLKTNLQQALMRICEFGIQPEKFDFIEAPSTEAMAKSMESLEQLNLVKNGKLTFLGKKVIRLPLEPRLSKLILLGNEAGIGIETIIIASLATEAGRLFLRHIDNRDISDKKKANFCQESGDFATFLEIYKRWREVSRHDRYNWCVENYISSKALNSAYKTMQEIQLTLQKENLIEHKVDHHYHNEKFDVNFEEIMFNCFSDNLCQYSGYKKMGYFSPHFKERLYIHPSSSICYLNKYPNFVIYSTLMETSRMYIVDVMTVSDETLIKANMEGNFNIQLDIVKSLQVVPKVLGPFGESVLSRHIIGKNGCKIEKLELAIKKVIKNNNFHIDINRDKGLVIVYAEEHFHEKIAKVVINTVQQAHSFISGDEEIIKVKRYFSFCLGSGGKVCDIIMPGEYKEIIIEGKKHIENVKHELKSFGEHKTFIDPTDKGYKLTATYMKVKCAEKAMLHFSRKQNVRAKKSGIFMEGGSGKLLPFFRIQVTWHPAVSTGKGYIEFNSEPDRITASGCLSGSRFYLQTNYIKFTPAPVTKRCLDISNLPEIVDEKLLCEQLTDHLKRFVKFKKVEVTRRKHPPMTEVDIASIKKELMKSFSHFSPPNKIIIDVDNAMPNSKFWTATAYFESASDGEKAFHHYNGKLTVNSMPASMEVISESCIHCPQNIFFAILEEIEKLKEEYKRVASIKTPKISETKSDIIEIKIKCQQISQLFIVHRKLADLVQGRTIECIGNRRYMYFFSMLNNAMIKSIEKQTKALIFLNDVRKSISIYGSKDNRRHAEIEVHALASKKIPSNTKVFDLTKSRMPPGFFKLFYEKFGYNLDGIKSLYDVHCTLDIVGNKLSLQGSLSNIKRVQQCIEDICIELHNKKKSEGKEDHDKDMCGICLDAIPYDYHRLENCGHAFCKTCLVLQISARVVPLVCVKQGCGKELFVIDIKKILAMCKNAEKEGFYQTVLQSFVSCATNEARFCPTPDCQMIYRIPETGTEFKCPSCQNVICTHCQVQYHYGMSCDMSQRMQTDEDYSLKVWMQKDMSTRKQCPQCKAVIEKSMGCNHMECIICNSHMCWLCLKIFPNSDAVYDHQPYCPNNQSVFPENGR